jgi:glyoxylase-like metal-dependent hydrolase (beta-lactamase superfamily II)
MDNRISFTRGAQLYTVNASDRICSVIQPFIQEIFSCLLEFNNFGQAILQAANKQKKIADTFFEIDPNRVEESFSLKKEFLLLQDNPLLALFFSNAKYPSFLGKNGVEKLQDLSLLPEIKNLFYLCGQSSLSYDQICQNISDPALSLLDRWLKCRIVQEQPCAEDTGHQNIPGVFRLQHASLLYRSKTTGVLVDPHLHSNYGIPSLKKDITRAKLEGLVDAILISHSHYDHWHYPTLMMFPAHIPIIVPKVPKGTITCEDMEARLKSLGFENVIAVDWYAEPIRVGDIDIHVLPFYGEQPLVPEYDRPKYPELRNWGNTYLLRTENYTSWFLIDAGSEPMASMLEVAEYVKQEFDNIDHIISNFQPLSYNSIGTDLSSWGIDIVANLLSNPQIFSVTNKQEGGYISTLGPKGVAEICAVVGAKSCLPYAHSWAELGERGINDEELIKTVEQELENLGVFTRVIPWRIGEGYLTSRESVSRQIFLEGVMSTPKI